MLSKGIAPRDFGEQFLVPVAKTDLFNGLTGDAVPFSHGSVAIR